MTSVFVIFQGMYEPFTRGIFSTREKAETARQTIFADPDSYVKDDDDLWIEEYTLDEID